MRLVSSERLVPSRGTSTSREVIQCREYIDAARNCLALAVEMYGGADDQVAGAPVPAPRARSGAAGGCRGGALGDLRVGPDSDESLRGWYWPKHTADAPRADAVDPTCGHFVERVVRGRDGFARPAVGALGEASAAELAHVDPRSRSLRPGSQPLRRMPRAADRLDGAQIATTQTAVATARTPANNHRVRRSLNRSIPRGCPARVDVIVPR